MKKRVIVSVSNDLSGDQRVKKQCDSLKSAGYEVILCGRKLQSSTALARDYKTVRYRLLWNNGVLFYACLNIRLFWFLLWRKTDFLWANDLDTLPANALISRLKGTKLIYDSHEYFTEVPELRGRKIPQGVWRFFERSAIAKCNLVITVSGSIVRKIESVYDISNVVLVRNVPEFVREIVPITKSELGVRAEQKLLILQGNGINVDRGSEELVLAMKEIESAVLLIIGKGDSIATLKEMVANQGLESKVIFKDSVTYGELLRYTAAADLGLSLDKGTNLNYQFSLPNKIFDYALSGTAVLASDLPEVRAIIEGNTIGAICPDITPTEIAKSVNAMLDNPSRLYEMGQAGRQLVTRLNWETEFAPVLSKMKMLEKA